ncbi:MAG: hypothetical protein ABH815_04010 [Candidatus Omnitrophota bacterium]
MDKNEVMYRRNLDSFFKPGIWWSVWILGALFLLYTLIFNAGSLLRYNYYLPGEIAFRDADAGKLFFLAVNMPFISFTCLFAGHVTLALYKIKKTKKV